MDQVWRALIIGLLAGAWAWVSPIIGVLTWPAFIGWAFYFVAGGETKALPNVGLPLLVGALLGWGAVLAMGPLGAFAPLAVVVIATAIMLLGSVPLLSLIPAQFAGAATFFGTGADLVATVIALALGLVIGVISVVLPDLLLGKGEPAAEG